MRKIKTTTRIINVRLPSDHWLFQEDNMSKVVRDALNLYKELHGELYQIKQSVQEVKDALNSGQLIINNSAKEKENSQEIDPRLANALNDFLDF